MNAMMELNGFLWQRNSQTCKKFPLCCFAQTKLTVSYCRRSKLTRRSILTDAELDKIGWVLYLHFPSLNKIETLDLLYGQYNELTLWISARSERIICLVTIGLMLLTSSDTRGLVTLMHLFLFTNNRPERTCFNMYTKYTQLQLTFLAL